MTAPWARISICVPAFLLYRAILAGQYYKFIGNIFTMVEAVDTSVLSNGCAELLGGPLCPCDSMHKRRTQMEMCEDTANTCSSILDCYDNVTTAIGR
jgi:hypothetical protein